MMVIKGLVDPASLVSKWNSLDGLEVWRLHRDRDFQGSSPAFPSRVLLLRSMWWLSWLIPLSRECRILGCRGKNPLQTPRGPYLLAWLVKEWAGLQVMFLCLVRRTTGALSWGLYASPLEIAVQSAVACSEAKDGLLVSWQLEEYVLVWVVSSSLAVEDDFPRRVIPVFYAPGLIRSVLRLDGPVTVYCG